ncbi:NusG domain II-containing protein [Gracilinema caldarium]|nr:NusG domain II-containing protein [Gracilinema caldarium]
MKVATAAAAIKRSITRFRPWDLVMLGTSIVITVSSFILVYTGNTKDLQVVIEGTGQSYIYPLSINETIPVQGPLGTTIVVIHHGNVHVEDSPCNNKLCIAMGEISLPGQWIACLPNQVFVRIIGTSAKDELDGSTY